MRKKKLRLSRATVSQLTGASLVRVVGGYAPEPPLHTENCTNNCSAGCNPPPPSNGCGSATCTCNTFQTNCVG